VLAGADDILIPTALSHELHQLIPGSRWRTTPGGHGCIWEHPTEFNAAFIGFLREHGNQQTGAG
jgi:3-oxoadipate enol-lactonase